jgi:tetratricopeptide (TPR) repeat protein
MEANEFLAFADDPALRSWLENHNLSAVTGCLGTGKTLLLKEFLRVAQEIGWSVGWVDRRQTDTAAILRALSSAIDTPRSDRAFTQFEANLKDMDQDVNSMSPSLHYQDRAVLRKRLSESFNKEELRTLCFDLGLEHDNLPDVRNGMARELVAHCERHGLIPHLIRECQRRRPNVHWSSTQLTSLLGNKSRPFSKHSQYLLEKFRKDLVASQQTEGVLFLIDDFELLAFHFRAWLLDLVREFRNKDIRWCIACWGSLPDWLPINKITDIWQLKGFSYDDPLRMKKEMSPQQLDELQEPPIFGMPILVTKCVRGDVSHRGSWWPMIAHLETWLQHQFGGRAKDALSYIRRCSVARYLDESIIQGLTRHPDLWGWLDESPLLVRRIIAGRERGSFDTRLRSILIHDLHRQNEKEYYALHRRLQNYFKDEIALPGWHHRVESWYHEWCVLPFEKILTVALNTALSVRDDYGELLLGDVGQLLEDTGIEPHRAGRELVRWGRLFNAASTVLSAETEKYEDAYEFFNAVCEEAIDYLEEQNTLTVWFGRGMARIELGELAEALSDFEKCLSVAPDDEEVQARMRLVREMLEEQHSDEAGK